MKRILVTGASGTTGSAVLRALQRLAPEQPVLAATRDPQKLAARMPWVAALRMDFDEPDTMAPAMQGVDTLFLVTGYSVGMLLHSKLVLDAARKAGIQHVVHLGAWGSGESRFPHLVWHDYVERYVQTSGFTWTHLQPKTFMRNVLTALRPGSTRVSQFYGDTVVGWVDPDDVAAVAATCLLRPEQHAGRTYPLAEDAQSVHGVAAILAEETGLHFVYERRDPRELAAILARAGMEGAYGESLAASAVAIAEGRVPGIADRYHTVQEVTGRPGTSWRAFVQRHRESIVKRAAAARQ